MKYLITFITCANQEEAKKIANFLLKKKLAACINIIPKVESLFWWKGKIDKASELLLVVKTKKSLFKKLLIGVKILHSYSCPEIIALPIIDGNKEYLKWLNDSTR
ncbi:MAG: divalent-cation tolerance protein CutA [Candidatus Omnitrophota bacterium]